MSSWALDEKRKKGFREDLSPGNLSIINTETDRELLDLLKQLNWELAV